MTFNHICFVTRTNNHFFNAELFKIFYLPGLGRRLEIHYYAVLTKIAPDNAQQADNQTKGGRHTLGLGH